MSEVPVDRVTFVPAHRMLPGLIRDPLGTLVKIGNDSGGEVVQLGGGPFRPYLLTHPAHVQHVLKEHPSWYVRDGSAMLWRQLEKIFGTGILSEGPTWKSSRETLQPLFTAKRVESLVDEMAKFVESAMSELDQAVEAGRSVDLGDELARIVCRTVPPVLFANRIPFDEAMRMMTAQDTIATAVLPRLVLPFVRERWPMPGDRPFRRSVKTMDQVIWPIVRAAKDQAHDGDDVISTLWRARTPDGRQLDEKQVRNDTVSMFTTATETTYGVLTWLWPTLEAYPQVAAKLQDEIDAVVGTGPVRWSHLRQLRYTKQVLDELLRLYPVGWLLPRTATVEDRIGGARIKPGDTLILSPYITHRMDAFWHDPEFFDPERFNPDQVKQRHRWSHFPFGAGPHQCLGQHLFYLEAQIIAVTILRRFRFRMDSPGVPAARIAAALRTSTRVRGTFQPVARQVAA